MGEEGAASPKGAYKEVPRPSRRLGLAATKNSLIDPRYEWSILSGPRI